MNADPIKNSLVLVQILKLICISRCGLAKLIGMPQKSPPPPHVLKMTLCYNYNRCNETIACINNKLPPPPLENRSRHPSIKNERSLKKDSISKKAAGICQFLEFKAEI